MINSDIRTQRMYGHFSEVAGSYNEIRTTDLEPILYIKDTLRGHGSIRALDVGCGGGRYSLLLFQQLPRLHLTCNDVNEAMVAESSRYLTAHGATNFSAVQADILDLQLEDASMDCIVTFNAIHHFDPVRFLHKTADALCKGGYVFIYTRLKHQNARTIWGRFFPGFCEKEHRLPDLAAVQSWMDLHTSVTLDRIEFFKFQRTATLGQLLHQAKNKHYSTFSLYSADEFTRALNHFETGIKRHFPDSDRIYWFDENVMIIFKKD